MTRRMQKVIGVLLLLVAAAVGFGGHLKHFPANLRGLLVVPQEAPQPPPTPEQLQAQQDEVMGHVARSAIFFVPLMILNAQPPE